MPSDPSAATVGEKLLVVDDAPQNVKLLRLILKGENYQVIEAYSGAEALEKLHSEHPAAMILDVRMPGMTGYEVCRRVREDPEFATLPVIMVTALSMPEERIKGIEAGATDFITKPFSKRELLARIRSSLSLAKAERSGIVPHLPGWVIITDPDWGVLCASPPAAEVLALGGGGPLIGRSLVAVLEGLGAEWLEEGAGFALQAPHGGAMLGRVTPVRDALDRTVARMVVLVEREAVGAPAASR